MKIVETVDVINGIQFSVDRELKKAWEEVENSISNTNWPHGSSSFTIYPVKHANGVKPIKIPCMESLRKFGWDVEKLPKPPGSTVLRSGKSGDLDALKEINSDYILFEWETGNISSSHRALNKLFLTMQQPNILGSFLVVPSDRMKVFLTDRVGNIGELRAYFPLWGNTPNIKGALRIVVVEHDKESHSVKKIPKGTDGRAKV